MSAANLCRAVCISDVMNEAGITMWQKYQILREPIFLLGQPTQLRKDELKFEEKEKKKKKKKKERKRKIHVCINFNGTTKQRMQMEIVISHVHV